MIWVLHNERTNCLRARVQARSFTNRTIRGLHGKAAERAVLTEITVLKLKSPSSTFTVNRSHAKNLRNLPCLMAEALKRYHS